jgi:predicted AAA+ superfamily ATPase
MNESLFYRYNPWWEEEFKTDELIERKSVQDKINLSIKNKEIILITGIRRVGKTSIMKLTIRHLIEKEKIDPSNIFYISLDDYLLSKYNIIEIIEKYRKIKRIPFESKIYVFLDEVAYKKDFELQLKNLYDNQNIKIFATSSSVSILKSKKPYLTGRNVIIEICPLDFEDFLVFRNKKITKRNAHLLGKYFEDFMQIGGIPEYVLRGNVEYLKELIDDIIKKDIVTFYGIKNPEILKDMFVLLMERAGKIMSINKIANILKISPDSARRYLGMFEETYLIHTISRRGKTTEKIISPKKLYASDLGIRNYFTGFRDKGSIFENYVFLKIKNLNPEYILENGVEIDFITKNNILMEVKYGLPMNKKQEFLFKHFKAKKKILINGFEDLEYLNFSG